MGTISTQIALTDNAIYKWTVSPAKAGEYYLTLLAGGDPGLAKPSAVIIDGVISSEATVGSLTADTWDYGDNDTLGYSTIYVLTNPAVDPDTYHAAGDFGGIVGQFDTTIPTLTHELQLETFKLASGTATLVHDTPYLLKTLLSADRETDVVYSLQIGLVDSPTAALDVIAGQSDTDTIDTTASSYIQHSTNGDILFYAVQENVATESLDFQWVAVGTRV